MTFNPTWFGEPILQSTPLQEADRAHLEHAKDAVLDSLEVAVCDCNGKRFKEREITQAMKTVARL